jgi:hypothetical protein
MTETLDPNSVALELLSPHFAWRPCFDCWPQKILKLQRLESIHWHDAHADFHDNREVSACSICIITVGAEGRPL